MSREEDEIQVLGQQPGNRPPKRRRWWRWVVVALGVVAGVMAVVFRGGISSEPSVADSSSVAVADFDLEPEVPEHRGGESRLQESRDTVNDVVLNVWEGILSLRSVSNVPLFVVYTLLIWACYFFHFYLTFYCFSFTAHLGVLAGLVMFVGGTFAVIVPTPNGAGPWHFAVITMMMLYGVSAADAGIFALIVHGIQTLLVIVLGLWGWLHLMVGRRHRG